MDRQTLPILMAVLGNLLVTAIAAFLVSFFPLLTRSIDVASGSADSFGNSIISNAFDNVQLTMATCARGFEGLDSAGIQDLYRIATPTASKYWEIRARLAGDLTMWLAYYEGTGVFVGRRVPCDADVPRTPNAATVWVTELHSNATYHRELWHMDGINSSVINGTRVGPFPTSFNPTATAWYHDYVNSIYAHWRPPEPDNWGTYTVMRIGAQGGLNNSARYCVYASEIDSAAITTLLKAIPTPPSGTLIVFDSRTKALLGANFNFDSLVNESGVLRPKTFTEIGNDSPFMHSIITEFQSVIEACVDSCTLDVGVSFSKTFVRVRRIKDNYGLNVVLVIGIRAIDFLSGIQQAQSTSLTITLPTLSGVVIILALVTWLTVGQAAMFLRRVDDGPGTSTASAAHSVGPAAQMGGVLSTTPKQHHANVDGIGLKRR